MPNRKDLTGQKFGRLTVLRFHRVDKSGRGTWLCQCDCGKTTIVLASKLTTGNTKSCGCAKKGVNRVDLSGSRFGRLTALYPTDKRLGNSVVWHCQCDCGNEADVASINLRNGSTRSCGCIAHERGISDPALESLKKYYIDGTDVLTLMQKPGPRNTSGTVGVSYDKSIGMWKAYIQFKKKIYRLGASRDKDAAIALRKEAEQHLHGEFLEWYYSVHPESKKKTPKSPD